MPLPLPLDGFEDGRAARSSVGIAAAADGDSEAAAREPLPTVAAPTYGDLTAIASAADGSECAAAVSSPSATAGSRLTLPPFSEKDAESAEATRCPPDDGAALAAGRAAGHDSSGDAADEEEEEADRGDVDDDDDDEEEAEDNGAEDDAVSTGDEADGGWYGGPDDELAEDDDDDDEDEDEACLADMALRTARMSTDANGCDMPMASTASVSALAADTRPLESTRMR